MIDFMTTTDDELIESLREAQRGLVWARERLAAVTALVHDRWAQDGVEALRVAGKDYGEVSFKDGQGRPFKVSRPLRVKWDSNKLQALASTMDWRVAQGIFKISFDVSEGLYKSLVRSNVNDELVNALNEARTTVPGELTVTYTG